MQTLEFGQDCVYFEGADPTNTPMLAKVKNVARDGAVCDLNVFPPVNGPVIAKNNVRHVDDPHYSDNPQQKRFGGFCTIEEHKAKLAQRIAAKRESDRRRELAEAQQPVSPLHIPGVDGKETPEQIIERLYVAGRIPAFIAEIIDSPEWPLERVVKYISEKDAKPLNDFIEAAGDASKKPKAKKEPALA